MEVLRGVNSGGGTALHAGWKEGARQVGRNLVPGGLNRVLLLSDGQANVGETNPDAIATEVNRFVREGVSTSTMGVGYDYNEDLLQAMARSGDGNYEHIERPEQLPGLFQIELKGLMATFGNRVSLGIEPRAGVTVTEVLNDFDPLPTGRWKLPNLVAGRPVFAVVRLHVPPAAHAGEWCRFRLGWDQPRAAGRQRLRAALYLPAVAGPAWEALTPNVEVQERAALLLIARAKTLATQCQERGDHAGAERHLAEAQRLLVFAADTPEVRRETEALAQLVRDLAGGEQAKFLKHAKAQSYGRRSSRPYRDA